MKTVSTAELAERIALELQTSEPQARAVLDHAFEAIKKELQRGNNIELSQFLSLQVRKGQTEESMTQAGLPLGLPTSRRVQFSLDETLRKSIEGSGLYKLLLVVPRKNFFTGVMAARLVSARSEVTIVEGEQAALETLATLKPDLVVLDAGLSNASVVVAELKKNRESSLTAVIQIGIEGHDHSQITDLNVMPDEHINEPFDLNDLVKLAESELQRFSEERNYFDHEMRFRLQTKEESLELANELIAHALLSSGLSEDASQSFAVAFREALDNAARHGNQSNETRYIDVQYLVDREKVTIAVQDEGEGFDTEIYLSRGVSGDPVEAARERYQAGGHGGLGIMLMLKCVDKIEYNYVGSKITLTRQLQNR